MFKEKNGEGREGSVLTWNMYHMYAHVFIGIACRPQVRPPVFGTRPCTQFTFAHKIADATCTKGIPFFKKFGRAD